MARRLTKAQRAKIARSMRGNKNAKGKRWTLSSQTKERMRVAALHRKS